MSKKVLVLGGGVAGLAAAVECARRGLQPVLLEERHFLGGRAYSFCDAVSGEELDNGQHVLLTCYRHTWKFLRTIGASDQLTVQKRLELPYREPAGQERIVRFGRWPFPLGWRASLGMLRGMARCGAGHKLDEMTVEEWLDACRQPEELRRTVYRPITLAALNQDPAKASAAMLVAVLRRAFSPWGNTRIAVPAVGLSRLFVEKALPYVQEHGGEIHCNHRVQSLYWDGNRIAGVQTAGGKKWTADFYLSALPAHVLGRLLPENLLSRHSSLVNMRKLEFSGIISVYLWLDEPLPVQRFVGLLDTKVQWLFRRPEGNALVLVISAADGFMDMPKDALLEIVREDLRKVCPEFGQRKILRSLVIREKRATISHAPGQLRYRPDSATPINNLLLAGDWVNTGLPATIESAVQSAHACVQEIRRRGT